MKYCFSLKKKLLSSSGNCLSGAELFGYVIGHPHWMTFMHYLRIHLAGFAHCKSFVLLGMKIKCETSQLLQVRAI